MEFAAFKTRRLLGLHSGGILSAATMRLPRFIAPTALRFSRSLFAQFGFDLVDLKPHNPDIKDGEAYRPMFSPWLMPEWKKRLRADDLRSLLPLQAKYVFYTLVDDAVGRSQGQLAECGVYKGGTAKILAERVSDRPIHLFDTFAGMPETDPVRDWHKAGDFADTSVESVRQYLSDHQNVTCVPGFVPDTLDVVQDCRFAFVHIDLDIYPAIKSACEFFYSRMASGGIILFDDYGYPSCPGARLAIDEFFADKPEVVMIYPTGQCSIYKR